jgi:hypothetical protein
MHRRRFLTTAGLAATVATAGCSGGTDGTEGTATRSGGSTAGSTPTSPSTATAGDGTATAPPGAESAAPTGGYQDVSLPVPESELHRGAGKDQIPAITEPSFGPDWSEAEASLSDDETVIGIERGGRARAYPLAILDWHEIVNDEFAGPLLVTYCPLCGSGVTADRLVDGAETTFGVSGLLWRSDLVMYDEATESLWSQVLGRAIRGPETGERLSLVPSTFTSWEEWRETHPDGEVLLPPPLSLTITDTPPRNYDGEAYAGYDESRRIGIGYNDFDDDRLHPKARVVGIRVDGTARAYPLSTVLDADGVVNDTVAGRPVVAVGAGDGTLAVYDRRVDGSTRSFQPGDDRTVVADGSAFDIRTGVAVDGPLEGSRLEQVNDRSPMFWFAWADFHPNTTVYGLDG